MKIKRIEHIAIAVDDLDGMAGMLRDKFGIEVEYSEDIARSRTRLAMLPVGESYIELLQGMAPSSRAAEWVAQKGQSLFHICFEVDDIDAALAELKAKGTPLLNETPIIGHGNCRIAFLDPKATGNILFELAEMPKDGRRRRALRCGRDAMPTLHPQIVQAIEAMRRAGLKPIEALSPEEARRQMEETAQSRKAEPLPVARVEDREIPGPAGPIRVRLYWPESERRQASTACRQSPIIMAAAM